MNRKIYLARPRMDYTKLSIADVQAEFRNVARDAQSTFGGLDGGQLNWRPDATRWSVAQCFEHLVNGNRLIFQAAGDALRGSSRTLWERMPLLPKLFGPALIRSQSPSVTRKYRAPRHAQPTTSAIGGDIIQRFVDQHCEAAAWVQSLDERSANAAIMTSPFIRMVTYSVMDALRVTVAHDHRHFEQARRVTQTPGFPAPSR